MPKAEGIILDFESTEKINVDILEALNYEGVPQLITYTTSEFSAVCPYSGLPDIAEVIIEYIPDKSIIELKSLKYYFISYRNVGIYQEDVTSRIFSDLKEALAPRYLSVYTKYNVRGGIDAECFIESGNKQNCVEKYVHTGETE